MKPLSKGQIEILKTICQNPAITYEEICQQLGVATSTVTRAIKHFKQLNIIVRSGADKNGFWIVDKEIALAIK